jgi:hypothetical protein
MNDTLKTLMNWFARPFPHINAVILTIFASLLFLSGIAIAFFPRLTEFLDIMQAPKLRDAIRVLSFAFFSCYCTLGCLCRILIQFFPDDFSDGQGHV